MKVSTQQVDRMLRQVHEVVAVSKKRRRAGKRPSLMISTEERFWNFDPPVGLQPPVGWAK